jgi:hypothetical protein
MIGYAVRAAAQPFRANAARATHTNHAADTQDVLAERKPVSSIQRDGSFCGALRARAVRLGAVALEVQLALLAGPSDTDQEKPR